MKKGIIIVFSNDENNIVKDKLINLFNQTDVHLCLINNGSKDKTLSFLKLIKDDVKTTVSILDIKKNKGTTAAVKAGARYLFSCEDLKFILYMKSNTLFYFKEIKKQLEIFKKNEVSFNKKLLEKNQRKILRNVFSSEDFLLSYKS